MTRRTTLTQSELVPLDMPAKLSRLHIALSPTQWLLCMLSAAALALFSGYLLMSRVDKSPLAVPTQWYDAAERFVLDTIRLSFTNHKLIVRDDHVYVAPTGILDKNAVIVLLDPSLVYAESSEHTAAPAVAPERVMDPAWEPDFSLLPLDRNSR